MASGYTPKEHVREDDRERRIIHIHNRPLRGSRPAPRLSFRHSRAVQIERADPNANAETEANTTNGQEESNPKCKLERPTKTRLDAAGPFTAS